MSLVRMAAVEEIPVGALREVRYGDTPVAICNVAGEIRAFQGHCPHRSGPLGQGNLYEGMIVCPWHAWEFRCDTGEYDYDPAIRLTSYPVKIRDGEIWVNFDTAGGNAGTSGS